MTICGDNRESEMNKYKCDEYQCFKKLRGNHFPFEQFPEYKKDGAMCDVIGCDAEPEYRGEDGNEYCEDCMENEIREFSDGFVMISDE